MTRIDHLTPITAFTDAAGKRVEGDFRLTRLVGELGYAHTAVLAGTTDPDGPTMIYPLTSVNAMEVEA